MHLYDLFYVTIVSGFGVFWFYFFFIYLKQAMELGKMDEERLLRTRKLVLLVDLDQTLIHTTNDNIPPNLKVGETKQR